MKKQRDKIKRALLKFAKKHDNILQLLAIISASICGIAFIAIFFWGLINTAEIWVSAVMVTATIGMFCFPKIQEFWGAHKQTKQQYIDSRREIAAAFFQSFFNSRERLPLEVEQISGRGEFLQRLAHYDYSSNLTVFTLRLFDMSADETASEKHRKIFLRQLQQYVSDFFASGEYVLPRYQDVPPMLFLRVEAPQSTDDFCFIIRFCYCDSLRNYQEAMTLKAKLDAIGRVYDYPAI